MKKRETRMCSRKKRFRNIAEAKRSRRNILINTGSRLRYYRCEYCKGYHLSSKEWGKEYVRREVKKT